MTDFRAQVVSFRVSVPPHSHIYLLYCACPRENGQGAADGTTLRPVPPFLVYLYSIAGPDYLLLSFNVASRQPRRTFGFARMFLVCLPTFLIADLADTHTVGVASGHVRRRAFFFDRGRARVRSRASRSSFGDRRWMDRRWMNRLPPNGVRPKICGDVGSAISGDRIVGRRSTAGAGGIQPWPPFAPVLGRWTHGLGIGAGWVSGAGCPTCLPRFPSVPHPFPLFSEANSGRPF